METAVTTEELGSRATSDVVTDAGTGSQRDQWVKIGDRIEELKDAYVAAAMMHLALALSSTELQNHVKEDRQMTHR